MSDLEKNRIFTKRKILLGSRVVILFLILFLMKIKTLFLKDKNLTFLKCFFHSSGSEFYVICG